MTADVTVTPNPNEIRDHKYVDKAELQAMFEEEGILHPIFVVQCLIHKFTGNSFTPWFKLIARDFLFGWWDELLARRGEDGKLDAKRLHGIVDGSKVVKMV